MSIKKYYLLFNLLSCCCLTSAFAWTHEVSLGYGTGQEVDESYTNHGVELNGKLYKFKPLDKTLYVTIDGTLSHWRSETPRNNQLTTIALAPDFRAYFADPNYHTYRPYLGVSFGATYLSSKRFGLERQGANIAFETKLGGGMEIGNQRRSVDLNLHFVHYCNAGLFGANHGFDIPYVFSVGYQF